MIHLLRLLVGGVLLTVLVVGFAFLITNLHALKVVLVLGMIACGVVIAYGLGLIGEGAVNIWRERRRDR